MKLYMIRPRVLPCSLNTCAPVTLASSLFFKYAARQACLRGFTQSLCSNSSFPDIQQGYLIHLISLYSKVILWVRSTLARQTKICHTPKHEHIHAYTHTYSLSQLYVFPSSNY